MPEGVIAAGAALEDQMTKTINEFAAARARRAPTHPGAILREDVLPSIGEPVMTVAKKLGVARQHLHCILAEQAPVTPEMALRLGKFCGNGAGL